MNTLIDENKTVSFENWKQYKIIDSDLKKAFNDIAYLAAYICKAPFALVSLLNTEFQCCQLKLDLDENKQIYDRQMLGLCHLCIEQKQPLIINNTLVDRRAANLPSVRSYPFVRFYAGIPLISHQGKAIGTICILDDIAREISQEQVEALVALSHLAVNKLELGHDCTHKIGININSNPLEEILGKVAQKEQLAITIASTFQGVTIADAQIGNSIVYANEAFSGISGYKLEEVIGQKFLFLQGADTDSNAIAQIHQAIAQRREITITLLNYRQNGQSFWNELKILPLFSETGELVYFLAIQTDVTARLGLEEKSDREISIRPEGIASMYENRFFTLSPDMLCIAGFDGYFKHLNPAFEKTLGYSLEELKAQPSINFVHPDDRQAKIAEFEKLASGVTTANFEERFLCKDGNYKWLSWTAFPVAEEGFIYAIAHDISAQKQIELEHLQCIHQEQIYRAEAEAASKITRNILESITDAFFVLDNEWRFTYLNHQAEQLLQKNQAELLGKNVWEEYPDAIGLAFYREYQKVAAQRVSVEFEEFYPLLNTWFEVHAYPSSEGVSVYFNNINRRKQVEEELRNISLTLENAVEGISQLDLEGRYISLNKAYANAFGYQPEEMIGMQWQRSIYAEDIPKILAAYQQIQTDGKVELETRGLRKDGSVFYQQVVMVAAYDAHRRLIGHHFFMKDINERKQAEQKIREQAALLNVATDAILVQDLDRKILFWNKRAELLYGWKAEEAIGADANQILYHEVSSTQLDKVQKILSTKGEWQGELHQLNKDRKEIIVESRWTRVLDDEGKPKSILVVNTDITEKKQLESQFLRTQRLESIGTLAGGIAHDLNNVLTPILMAVQLLENQFGDRKNQRLLKTLENNVKRGAALVKQVLSFARGIEGKRTILQVRHLISEIKQIAKETFPKSIELYVDLPQNLWAVSGDVTQLHQVFMNLVVNARDAMPNGGILSILGQNMAIDESYVRMNFEAEIGPYIVITVLDTGIGIPPAIIDRIFEPFFTTKEFGKGTGLGLSTVTGIIKSHGGFIKVNSEVDKGTEFKVFLPAVDATETQEAAEDLELLRGQGELILVVDDEPAIRDITKASLETYAYKVITASDGIEAVAMYAQHKHEISVVLIDIMMPSMDGTTAIRTLQRINPNVKVIAVSGISSNEMVVKASGANIKAFLSKPYTAKELLKILHGVIIDNS